MREVGSVIVNIKPIVKRLIANLETPLFLKDFIRFSFLVVVEVLSNGLQRTVEIRGWIWGVSRKPHSRSHFSDGQQKNLVESFGLPA